MTEHREETVLGQTGSFRLGPRFTRRFIKSGVIDGKGSALGQFFREREFFCAAGTGRSIDHGDGPEDAIMRRQRDGNERTHADGPDKIALPAILKQFAQSGFISMRANLGLFAFKNPHRDPSRGRA